MAKSITNIQKMRGRPKSGVTPIHNLRLPDDLRSRIEAWITAQMEPKPSRSEAIRRLVEQGLAAEGAGSIKPLSDAALDTKIAEQKAKIADMPEHEVPSPEAALATMDKALAENDLVKLKNKRTLRKIKK